MSIRHTWTIPLPGKPGESLHYEGSRSQLKELSYQMWRMAMGPEKETSVQVPPYDWQCGALSPTTPRIHCTKDKGHEGPHGGLGAQWAEGARWPSFDPTHVPDHIERTLDLMQRMAVLEEQVQRLQTHTHRVNVNAVTRPNEQPIVQ